MPNKFVVMTMTALAAGGLLISAGSAAMAQTQEAAATAAESIAPEPLSAEDLEVLVARIALYPDELVAVIVAASLYPLQIVEAERYLDQVKTKKDLKPKSDWDGSVVSLLNYPQIVTMMSEDLEWTQALGDAISNQQKDVLEAIQQLRDKAVAEGIIKTDDKVKVVKENDNIVIQPASPEVIYVPQYEPQILYETNYVAAPITYWPDPYPSYYYPTAPYFAAFVTGAVWGAVVDWDDWGVWGGNGNWGNDIDIDCNNCFNNNFNGKVNINDVDWKNVDRNKINIDKNQFNKIDRKNIKNGLEQNNRNNIKNKSADLKKNRPSTMPAKGNQVKDVRKSTLDGLQSKPGGGNKKPGQAMNKPGQGAAKPGQGDGGNVSKPGGGGNKPGGGNYDRPTSKPKPAARPDSRPKNASPLGEVNRGKSTKNQSNRGGKSMGGGMGGGGKSQKKFVPPRRSGGGGGGRGGGGGGRGRR